MAGTDILSVKAADELTSGGTTQFYGRLIEDLKIGIMAHHVNGDIFLLC